MSAVLATPPYLAFYDLNGAPLAGGLVYTYAAGTTTPLATYTDQSGTVPQTNPIVLDSAGRATWWLIGAYKYIVKDALGNTIATTDNVTSFSTLAAAGSSFFQSFSGDGTTTAFTLSTDEGTDSKGLMVFVDSGQVSDIANGNFATDTIWTKGTGWTIGSGVATATGAISTAISQTATQTLVQGKSYAVTYTITQSAGTLVASVGGQAGIIRSVAGTYSDVIVAGATQAIAFTGAGFTGTLASVTVTLANGKGYQILNPNQYTIAGTALTIASAPASGTNNIFVFAPSSLLGAASSAAALAQGYAAAALTSQTAAAISASSAAGYAAAKNQWTYSNNVNMANPGTGFLRFNNSTISLATAIAVSDLSANSGNPDLTAWLATWDDSTSSPRGSLQIFKDNGNFAIFTITGANIDNTGWKQIAVSNISSAGTFNNNDTILVGFTAYGTTTVTGGITALTGDVTASGSGSVAATLASVNSNVGNYGSATQIPQLSVDAKGRITAIGTNTASAGKLVARVRTNVTGTTSGGTAIPLDSTIPQNTEGFLFGTAAAYTPLSTSNTVVVKAFFWLDNGTNTYILGSLIQDSTANAVAAGMSPSSGTGAFLMLLEYQYTPSSLTATTFTFRAGDAGGSTIYRNQDTSGNTLGGMVSYIEISEYTP